MLSKLLTYLKKSIRFASITTITVLLVAVLAWAAQIYPDIIVKGAPWYDIRGYTSLSTALTAIGSSEKTLLVLGNVAVSADANIPSTTNVWYLGGGKFTIATGKVLTHNGSVTAGNYVIWVGPGTIVPPAVPLNLTWMDGLTKAVALLTTATCEVEISSAFAQTVDVTTPSTMTISFKSPGAVTVSNSKAWTIQGPIYGRRGCFQGNGASVPSALQVNEATWWPSLIKAVADIGSLERTVGITSPTTISGTLNILATTGLTFSATGSLDPAGGTTLTIYSPVNEVRRRLFNGAGTTILASASQGYVYPEWWYSGTGDWDTALQAANDSIKLYGGELSLAGRTYVFTTFNLNDQVSIIGANPKTTILDVKGNGIVGAELLDRGEYRNFTMTHASAPAQTPAGTTGILTLFDAAYGAFHSTFENLIFLGYADTTLYGLRVRGAIPAGTATATTYHNRFINLTFKSGVTNVRPNGAYALAVGDTNPAGISASHSGYWANNNYFEKVVISGFETAFLIKGASNHIVASTVMGHLTLGTIIGFNFTTTNPNYLHDITFDQTWAAGTYKVVVNSMEDSLTGYGRLVIATGISNFNLADITINALDPDGVGVSTAQFAPTYNDARGSESAHYSLAGTNWLGASYSDGLYRFKGGPLAIDGMFAPSGSTYTVVDSASVPVKPFGSPSLVGNKHGSAGLTYKTSTSGTNNFTTQFSVGAVSGAISTAPAPVVKTITGINTSNEELTIAAHGLVTAQKVTFVQTGGGDPGNLTSGTRYYVIYVTAGTLKLATTEALAVAGTAIDISSAGSGTLVLYTGGPVGTFTCSAANTVTVYNAIANTTSNILLLPNEATAQAYELASGRAFVKTKNDGSFVVQGDATAGAAAFAGTEVYEYFILN